MVFNIKQKKLLFLGCGATAKCTLAHLEKLFTVTPRNMAFVDKINYSSHPDVKKYTDRGASYIIRDINKDLNVLLKPLRPGDIVIDLSNRTESLDIIKECVRMNLHYLNTSMENKQSIFQQRKHTSDYKMSYTYAHERLRKLPASRTIMIEMGMNPGLVNVFVKHALRHIVTTKYPVLKPLLRQRKYANIAETVGLRTIHISETDSSEFVNSSDEDGSMFYNTWCCNGLNDEYAHNAEFSYGTHEDKRFNKYLLSKTAIELPQPANKYYTESYVPGERMLGCIIPHGEGLSLGRYLQTPLYSPTVQYVYKWSPLTQRSLHRFNRSVGHTFFPSHVMNNYDDNFKGTDKVGALLLLKNKQSVWCGSMLDNSDTGHHSGTITQVAAGILLGLAHIVQRPRRGVVWGEDIPESDISLIKPMLGNFFCDYVPYWRPPRLNMLPKEEFDKQYR